MALPNRSQENDEWRIPKPDHKITKIQNDDMEDLVSQRIRNFNDKLNKFIEELKDEDKKRNLDETTEVNKIEIIREENHHLKRLIKQKDIVIQNLEDELDVKIARVNDLRVVIENLQIEIFNLREQETEFLSKISSLQDELHEMLRKNQNISSKIQKAVINDNMYSQEYKQEDSQITSTSTTSTITLEGIVEESELALDLIRTLEEKKEIKLVILAMMLRSSQDMCIEIIDKLVAMGKVEIRYSSNNDHNPTIQWISD